MQKSSASGLRIFLGVTAVVLICFAVATWLPLTEGEGSGEKTSMSLPPAPLDSVPAARGTVRRRTRELPGRADVQADFTRCLSEYEAALKASNPADESDLVHDRCMAIDRLGAVLDGLKGRTLAAGLDREIVASRLASLYPGERSAEVREHIVEALGSGDSSAVGRGLWAALADDDEDVRASAEFQIELLLDFTDSSSNRARTWLEKRLLTREPSPEPRRSEAIARLRAVIEEERR